MDPQSAARLVSALDAELQRRRRRKFDSLVAQWRAEYADLVARSREEAGDDETSDADADFDDDDGDIETDYDAGRAATYVLCRSIEYQRANGPFPAEFFPEPSEPDERWRLEEFFAAHGGVPGVADKIALLAKRLKGRDRILKAQRNGAPQRRPVVIGPRVRAAAPSSKAKPVIDILAKSDGPTSAPRKSRTEIWREQEQAKLEARLAYIRPPQSGQEPAGSWMFGTVQKYDSRTMSGVVTLGGASARLELSFGMSAIMRAGITTLSPGQSLECHLMKQPDGTVVVAEIKLSVGDRAKALADAERQAQAAEENYRVELMRRGLH
jgi:hypothetical protein